MLSIQSQLISSFLSFLKARVVFVRPRLPWFNEDIREAKRARCKARKDGGKRILSMILITIRREETVSHICLIAPGLPFVGSVLKTTVLTKEKSLEPPGYC